MWYFDFEWDMFDETGKRDIDKAVNKDQQDKWIEKDGVNRQDFNVLKRKRFNDRQMGMPGQGHVGKKGIIMVKPYIFNEGYPLDRQRVFGRYLCSGRPHEKVDVQISRLAL